MKRRCRDEPCATCGHYHDYEGGEPCSVCGHRLAQDDVQTPSVLPTELLPGFLFLGSYDHASRQDLLKTLGIEHVLNTVPTCPNLYKNSFDYHTAAASPPPLDECCAFLERVRAAGGKVLVHCMTGTSRAPAVVVCYLMRVGGLRLDAAYALVKAKRPSVAFHEADAVRLQEAEAAVFGPGASGFRVPIGRQQQQQQQQAVQQEVVPFGWPGHPAPGAGAAHQGREPGGPLLLQHSTQSGGPFGFGPN